VTELPFHPLLASWFRASFAGATSVQRAGWQRIAAGDDTLISAPTGSGKTLAAFLWALNELCEHAVAGTLEDRVHVVYVSPLKALSNDIEKNLALPLRGVRERAESEGTLLGDIRTAVRTGDTPARERQLQIRHPPHILITTPESLYILLTAEKSRRILGSASTVIVDEIHALAADKRGAHLALTLERLDRLCGRRLQRIGLSATQKPIEEVAHFLVGSDGIDDDGRVRCAIVDDGHERPLDLAVEVPDDFELGPIPTLEHRAAVYERIVELVRSHRATIVFTNTRRMVERVSHALAERLGKENVRAHHGSLSRATRLGAEQGLKSGDVQVVVATASLELGIDVGHVDLVCHFGAPRSIAQLLQRVGRSGHFLGAIPKGVLFPFTRDELVQCAAAVRAVRFGELDAIRIVGCARDVLAQQVVATVASEGDVELEDLRTFVRKATPYRELADKDFDDVVEMLAEGVSTRRGRRNAHLHFDRVHARLRPRRGARLAAITSGGAIPETADYDVVEDPSAAFVGTVNEDFAIESLPGDVFQLGNRSWRVQRVERGRMRVRDAEGAPPNIPFWLGESPGRTRELSAAVASLRTDVVAGLDDRTALATRLVDECRVSALGAEQIIAYLREALAVLGTMPTQTTLVAERFFDEAGGMQLVIHSPFGARLNRALGLALRKRFCVSFDFELQAAATDDGIVLSLGEQHSFPVGAIFEMCAASRLRTDLTQAALQAPMFTNRWRWNATRSLALLRFLGGKKVPVALQRMRAEDLLAAVFPAQTGCQDNRVGHIEPPDHPLVTETLDDCLHEAMDLDGLLELVHAIGDGTIRTVGVETPSPSALAHEILNANPYAFLDDAPLEERRARAVTLRRFDPDLAQGLGALDPAAIEEVCKQAWPLMRDADEAHDALLTFVVLPILDPGGSALDLEALVGTGRAVIATYGPDETRAYVASERAPLVAAALERSVTFAPEPAPIARVAARGLVAADARATPSAVDSAMRADPDTAVSEIVRGWMECIGPVTADALASRLGLPVPRVAAALARLEAEGAVLRGSFTASKDATEWCERGLLARIHRLTLGVLRREIEPVSQSDFMRFLFRWQHAADGSRLHGRDGVRRVIEQLEGIEIPAPAWERDVLPARIESYDPAFLEALCLAGDVAWGRLSVGAQAQGASSHEISIARRPRARQLLSRAAPLAFFLRADSEWLLEPFSELVDGRPWRQTLTPVATEVLAHLERYGASFLPDIARGIRRLPTETEKALWELVAAGLVAGDGVAGLRTLLLPEAKRKGPRPGRHLRAVPGLAHRRAMPSGRWALLRALEAPAPPLDVADVVAQTASRWLARYGVVFRDVIARERRRVPWRAVLHELRRREARGEVRGGRFVDGVGGEQFAVPGAVEALRAIRRTRERNEVVVVAAADPLNLVGIVTPGERVSPFSRDVIAYRDGTPVEIGELGRVRSRLRAQGS
jgi:ATP-dependent Lhr-like helicase